MGELTRCGGGTEGKIVNEDPNYTRFLPEKARETYFHRITVSVLLPGIKKHKILQVQNYVYFCNNETCSRAKTESFLRYINGSYNGCNYFLECVRQILVSRNRNTKKVLIIIAH